MSTIDLSTPFRERRALGQAALIPYVCAGYPDRDASLALLHAAADAGADILELGVPFSDPLADGPTIQAATFHALEGGMTLPSVLGILREFRETRSTPVVLFTYLNPVYRYGVRRFVADARSAGAQGVLLTDLPAGADPELEDEVQGGGLDLIRLIAPTSSIDRTAEIGASGSGFVYYISRTGVTGARSEVRSALGREIAALRERISLPIAVGFGISTPEQAAEVAAVSDGVVVGSALVDEVTRGGVEAGGTFLRALRAGMDAAIREPSAAG